MSSADTDGLNKFVIGEGVLAHPEADEAGQNGVQRGSIYQRQPLTG